MPSMHLSSTQRQTPGLSPRLQQAVWLLQLTAMEFNQQVRAALADNPFLDEDETLPTDDAASAADDERDQRDERNERDDQEAKDDAAPEGDEAPLWNEDREFNSGGSDSSNDGEGGPGSSLERIPLDASLASHLHGQLNLINMTARDMTLAKSIVESLDDDGYLRLDADELIAMTGLEPACTPGELQVALKRVQSLDPAGVGARDLVECLLLQLDGVSSLPQRALMERIIRDRLGGVARKDSAALAHQLALPEAEVEAAVAAIRRLDPRPGWRFGAADIHYIVPDVTVRRGRKGWTASLNPAVVPRVRLHDVYAEMYQRERRHANPELAARLRDARWTVRNIEQRFATILGVSQAILARQPMFFEHGPLGMKPLALRTIADDVGVHESTVCRVTNGKYMSTPFGVFELKYFFSRAMTSSAGAEVSGTAIRRLVKEMLDGEPASAPLSDAEITRRLAQQGLTLSRRTITKYRLAMKVGGTRERRKAAPAASASI